MSPIPPRHIAIIMDGNGRWAKDKHMPRSAGHKKGVDVARNAIEYFARAGVRYLRCLPLVQKTGIVPMKKFQH